MSIKLFIAFLAVFGVLCILIMMLVYDIIMTQMRKQGERWCDMVDFEPSRGVVPYEVRNRWAAQPACEEAVASGEEVIISGEEAVAFREEAILSGKEAILSREEAILSGEEAILSGEEAIPSGKEAVAVVQEREVFPEEPLAPERYEPPPGLSPREARIDARIHALRTSSMRVPDAAPPEERETPPALLPLEERSLEETRLAHEQAADGVDAEIAASVLSCAAATPQGEITERLRPARQEPVQSDGLDSGRASAPLPPAGRDFLSRIKPPPAFPPREIGVPAREILPRSQPMRAQAPTEAPPADAPPAGEAALPETQPVEAEAPPEGAVVLAAKDGALPEGAIVLAAKDGALPEGAVAPGESPADAALREDEAPRGTSAPLSGWLEAQLKEHIQAPAGETPATPAPVEPPVVAAPAPWAKEAPLPTPPARSRWGSPETLNAQFSAPLSHEEPKPFVPQWVQGLFWAITAGWYVAIVLSCATGINGFVATIAALAVTFGIGLVVEHYARMEVWFDWVAGLRYGLTIGPLAGIWLVDFSTWDARLAVATSIFATYLVGGIVSKLLFVPVREMYEH